MKSNAREETYENVQLWLRQLWLPLSKNTGLNTEKLKKMN